MNIVLKMPAVQTLTVLFKDNGSDPNRKTYEFLSENLYTINSNGFRIDAHTVKDEDIKKVMMEGFKQLPAARYNGVIVYGASKIIEAVTQIVQQTSQNKQSLQKMSGETTSEDDELLAFMKEELSNDDQEESDAEEAAKMKAKAAQLARLKGLDQKAEVTGRRGAARAAQAPQAQAPRIQTGGGGGSGIAAVDAIQTDTDLLDPGNQDDMLMMKWMENNDL